MGGVTRSGGGERLLRLLAAALLVAALIRGAMLAWRLPVARLADVTEAGPGGIPRLVFLFQPGDCESYDGLIRRWNRIHRETDVPVVGAALRFPSDTAARRILLWSAGTEFPVRFDLGSRVETLALRLGFERTPLTVLVDDRGRPLLVLPPVTDPTSQDRYERVIRMVAGETDPPPTPVRPDPGTP